MKTSPSVGDMYACQKCQMQIQVTKGCDCDGKCAELNCCGEPMRNITEPATQQT